MTPTTKARRAMQLFMTILTAVFKVKPLAITFAGLGTSLFAQTSGYSYMTSYFAPDGRTLYATTITSGLMQGGSGNHHSYTAYTNISGPAGTQAIGQCSTVSSGSVPAEYYTTVASDCHIETVIPGVYYLFTRGTAFCDSVGRTFYDTGENQSSVQVDCKFPTGETSTYAGIDPDTNYRGALFNGKLTGPASFVGRRLGEAINPEEMDSCHFDGSAYEKDTTYQCCTGGWTVRAGDVYGPDMIGWPRGEADYYQNVIASNGAPYTSCGMKLTQSMYIDGCGGASQYYQTQWIVYTITANAITVERAGASGAAK